MNNYRDYLSDEAVKLFNTFSKEDQELVADLYEKSFSLYHGEIKEVSFTVTIPIEYQCKDTDDCEIITSGELAEAILPSDIAKYRSLWHDVVTNANEKVKDIAVKSDLIADKYEVERGWFFNQFITI